MKRYLTIAGVLATGLLSGVALAACGGDDSPETPIVVTDQTQQLSKDEFIAQADAICAEANTAIADIADAGEGITRASDVAELRQGVVTDIRDLGDPIEDSAGASSTDPTSDSFGTDSTATDTSDSATEDTSTFPESDTSDTGGTDATGTDTSATGTDTSATGTDTGTTAPGNDLERFLAAMQEQVRAGEKIDLATQRGETTAEAEAELQAAKDEAAEAATSFGFDECGTEGTPSTTSEEGTGSTSGTSSASPTAPATPAPSAPSDTGGGTDDSGGDTGGGVSPGGGGVGPSP